MAELFLEPEENIGNDIELNPASIDDPELTEEVTIYEDVPLEDLPEDITDDLPLSEIDDISVLIELEEQEINELIQDNMQSNTDLTEEQETDTDNEYIKSISDNVEVIMQNQKIQADNMNLLSGVGLCIQCMFFGGFIIYCFLNRIG